MSPGCWRRSSGGNVVVKLANDEYDVAAPPPEFSSVLSDDDLIEIATLRSEGHRVAIASRARVADRVGEAIVEHGGSAAVGQLVRNANAELGRSTLERLVVRAAGDDRLAVDLRNRSDLAWASLRQEVDAVSGRVLETLGGASRPVDPVMAGKLNVMVYNRLRNGAGFNAGEWKVAYNQVKALSDRRSLHEQSVARFVRFGYGHHAAAALAILLRVQPEVLVKWLAMQDYAAVTVASRALGFGGELFEGIVAVLPWRDTPSDEDRAQVRRRFEAVSIEEAKKSSPCGGSIRSAVAAARIAPAREGVSWLGLPEGGFFRPECHIWALAECPFQTSPRRKPGLLSPLAQAANWITASAGMTSVSAVTPLSHATEKRHNATPHLSSRDRAWNLDRRPEQI